jgi:topoisomerase-4 subunit B
VRLVVDEENDASSVLDMLLSKKRAGDRKSWLERKGDMAELV